MHMATKRIIANPSLEGIEAYILGRYLIPVLVVDLPRLILIHQLLVSSGIHSVGGENLESRMIVENVQSLPRSIFVINCQVLCVKPLPLQIIVSSDRNAFPLTNHLFTNLGSDSNYYGAMILFA